MLWPSDPVLAEQVLVKVAKHLPGLVCAILASSADHGHEHVALVPTRRVERLVRASTAACDHAHPWRSVVAVVVDVAVVDVKASSSSSVVVVKEVVRARVVAGRVDDVLWVEARRLVGGRVVEHREVKGESRVVGGREHEGR